LLEIVAICSGTSPYRCSKLQRISAKILLYL